ncbi:MAG: hypothetical protein J6K17_08125 [Oscillospiraceae bacterium]|nr:hypothetical protein [Oscillospiraceae bacterium]
MKLKKVLAGVLASAMALTTMTVTSFAATKNIETSNYQFMLKLTSSNESTTNYDGNYAGTGTATSLTLSGSNIKAETAAESTGLSFSFAAGLISDAEYDVGTEFTATITGLTIVATNGEKTETLLDNKDLTWVQAKQNGWFSGDQSLDLATISFTDIADFKDDGSIQATWTSLTLTTEVEDEPSTEEPTPEPEPSASTVLWEGSAPFTASDWSSDAAVVAAGKFDSVAAGDTIKITYSVGCADAAYQQFAVKIPTGNWDVLPSFNGGKAYDCTADSTSYTFTVAEGDVETLKANGFVVQGYNVTITKIELLSATGETPSIPTTKPEVKPEETPAAPISAPSAYAGPSIVPANSSEKFEITDPVTGKAISASVNKLAKALSKITDGSELTFDVGSRGLVLRKNVIQEIVDNDLTLTVKTSKATFIIDAENLAKVKTINIPAIMKTAEFKKLVKEGNTFNVIVTEKNKVEIELA